MAANSQSRGIASLGKRLVSQIRSRSALDPTPSSSISLGRAVHVSVYDKNLDDQALPTLVPDEVTQPQSEKYWAPHPKTGVFGPASEQGPSSGSESGLDSGPKGSVLEEKAFFRPLENLEKPQPQP